jgi:hypothetical protein
MPPENWKFRTKGEKMSDVLGCLMILWAGGMLVAVITIESRLSRIQRMLDAEQRRQKGKTL